MTRFALLEVNKKGQQAIFGLENYARNAVDPKLYELIKLRASVLNGCGFCVDMHATEGAHRGIPQRVLHAVSAWQHARSLFEPRELAVLALTDAVTKIGPDSVTDEIWTNAAQYFDEEELSALLIAICTINVWNWIAIATEMEPPVSAEHPLHPENQ